MLVLWASICYTYHGIMNKSFGQTLSDLRVKQNLTVQQLADRADVNPTLISGLQNNNRTIGENNARRIGRALELTGTELDAFVYLAINAAKDRVLEAFRTYPAEVINLVALELNRAGIGPDVVSRCVLHPKLQDGLTPDAAIYLKDGRSALIEIKVLER